MILKWGRKGLLAGALAVTFVTPVAPPSITSINEVQYRPDIRFEFRHLTPVEAPPTVTPGGSSKRPHGAYIRQPGERKRQKFDARRLAALAILAIQEYYG